MELFIDIKYNRILSVESHIYFLQLIFLADFSIEIEVLYF